MLRGTFFSLTYCCMSLLKEDWYILLAHFTLYKIIRKLFHKLVIDCQSPCSLPEHLVGILTPICILSLTIFCKLIALVSHDSIILYLSVSVFSLELVLRDPYLPNHWSFCLILQDRLDSIIKRLIKVISFLNFRLFIAGLTLITWKINIKLFISLISEHMHAHELIIFCSCCHWYLWCLTTNSIVEFFLLSFWFS